LRRSPYLNWVFEAWDEIVLEKGALLTMEERNALWVSLFERTFQDGQWTVSLADAELVSTSGMYLCWEACDYAGARDICRLFLNHPGATAHLLECEYPYMITYEALHTMRCGEEQEGATRLLETLENAERPTRLVVHCYSCIHQYLTEPPLFGVPTEALNSLVVDLLQRKRAPKKIVNLARSAKDYEELEFALDWITEQERRKWAKMGHA
jgi:hypothetical protein